MNLDIDDKPLELVFDLNIDMDFKPLQLDFDQTPLDITLFEMDLTTPPFDFGPVSDLDLSMAEIDFTG